MDEGTVAGCGRSHAFCIGGQSFVVERGQSFRESPDAAFVTDCLCSRRLPVSTETDGSMGETTNSCFEYQSETETVDAGGHDSTDRDIHGQCEQSSFDILQQQKGIIFGLIMGVS